MNLDLAKVRASYGVIKVIGGVRDQLHSPRAGRNMKNFTRLLYFTLLMIVASMCSIAWAQQAYPKDVIDFINSRDLCDSLRGDIPDPSPDNAKEEREFVDEVNKSCDGTDDALASLKKKYSTNSVIMQKLNSYEPRIEAKR